MSDSGKNLISSGLGPERTRERAGADGPSRTALLTETLLDGHKVGDPSVGADCHVCGDRVSAHDSVTVVAPAPVDDGRLTLRLVCQRCDAGDASNDGETTVEATASLGVLSLPGCRGSRLSLCHVEAVAVNPADGQQRVQP